MTPETPEPTPATPVHVVEQDRRNINQTFAFLKAALEDVDTGFGTCSPQEFVLLLLEAELVAKDLANVLGHTRVHFGMHLEAHRRASETASAHMLWTKKPPRPPTEAAEPNKTEDGSE